MLDLCDHALAFLTLLQKLTLVIPRGSGYLTRTKSTGRPSTGTNGFRKVLSDSAGASPRRPSR